MNVTISPRGGPMGALRLEQTYALIVDLVVLAVPVHTYVNGRDRTPDSRVVLFFIGNDSRVLVVCHKALVDHFRSRH